MIYLDNMAGTMPDPRVSQAMIPWISEKYGNPSAHFYPLGRESYVAIEEARKKVARMIKASKAENIIFTSNGTESNNLAIKGILNAVGNNKKHVIISEIEHFSIKNTLAKMVGQGVQITQLKVSTDGLIDINDLKNSIRPDTALVSIMYANPEIGSINDVKAIGSICREKGVIFHTDAVAAAGLLAIDVNDINADMLTISAQNFHGPRGAAALYIRDGITIKPLFDGGNQEFGIRSGSENVAAIVGMGVAADIVSEELSNYTPKMYELRDYMINKLTNMFEYLHITGGVEKRLPGHVSFWVEYIEGESILMWYAIKGIFAASGSACSSNILAEDEEDLAASHVLTAVGVPTDICAGSITMSMSKYTTKEDIDKTLEVTPEIILKLVEMSPAFNKGK